MAYHAIMALLCHFKNKPIDEYLKILSSEVEYIKYWFHAYKAKRFVSTQ